MLPEFFSHISHAAQGLNHSLQQQGIHMDQNQPGQASFDLGGAHITATLTEKQREEMINNCLRMQNAQRRQVTISTVAAVASVALSVLGCVALAFSIKHNLKENTNHV